VYNNGSDDLVTMHGSTISKTFCDRVTLHCIKFYTCHDFVCKLYLNYCVDTFSRSSGLNNIVVPFQSNCVLALVRVPTPPGKYWIFVENSRT